MSGAYAAADFKESLNRLAAMLAERRDELCRLDGAVGDGDHGIAMADGFGAAAKAAVARRKSPAPGRICRSTRPAR
jgi:phosphoenolpyruvate---glycerone phosphotransferase subunit DhaL